MEEIEDKSKSWQELYVSCKQTQNAAIKKAIELDEANESLQQRVKELEELLKIDLEYFIELQADIHEPNSTLGGIKARYCEILNEQEVLIEQTLNKK